MNPNNYNELIFNQSAKNVHWEKEITSIHCVGATGYPLEKNEIGPYLIQQIRINSVKNLNITFGTLKLPGETWWQSYTILILLMMFYTWNTKLKIGKWNYIKIKSFCMINKKH
jgi:hypothetical protein